MWLLIFSIVTVVVAGQPKQQAIPGPGQVLRPGRVWGEHPVGAAGGAARCGAPAACCCATGAAAAVPGWCREVGEVLIFPLERKCCLEVKGCMLFLAAGCRL